MSKKEKEPLKTTVSASDLDAFIVANDDFAFELEVFNTVVKAGFNARHAGLYEDPLQSKVRQFDVRASKQVVDRGIPLNIHLTVECKNLRPAFPLIVSCVPRSDDDSYHEVMTTNIQTSRRPLMHRSGTFYQRNQPVGKAMRQIGWNKENVMTSGDDGFDKSTQALASAADIIDSELTRIANVTRIDEWVAVLPILVVSDDALWIKKYDFEGAPDGGSVPAGETPFFVGRKYTRERDHLSFTISHLHIQTRSRFKNFISEIVGGGAIWRQLFPV